MTPEFEMGFQIAVIWLDKQEFYGDELIRFAGKRLRELKAADMSDEACINALIHELLSPTPASDTPDRGQGPIPPDTATEKGA